LQAYGDAKASYGVRMIIGAHDKPTCRTVNGADPVALTIWGDSIIGKAMVLLLSGVSYEARFLPASPPGEPISLEGSRLLMLTPTPQLSTEQRDTFLKSLLSNMPRTAKIPVLELTPISPSEAIREGRVPNESWHKVPWPCRVNDLEQCIEAALSASLPAPGGKVSTEDTH
jgi:hypothetical protein